MMKKRTGQHPEDLDDPRWIPGSAVRVALPRSDSREVLTVSRDALVLREEAIYVFRVNEDSTVERIIVRPGIGQGEMIEVIGPLNEGDSIVIRGAERLRPGQTVDVQTRIAEAV